jgi:hypothetical protein
MALVVAAEYEFGGRKKRPPGVRKTSGIRYQVSGIRYQVAAQASRCQCGPVIPLIASM